MSHTLMNTPTKANIENQLKINANKGLSSMSTNLDCMHYRQKNCLIGWQGQFQNKDGKKFIILEVIANQSFWIWHVDFGLPNGNNDINVLNQSLIVTNMIKGVDNDLKFKMNDKSYL